MTLPAALVPVVEDPARSILATDFDGTLSRIVDDPSTAQPLPEVRDTLAALVPHLQRVAVVSGRPVEFLLDRLPVDGLVLIGQYGFERCDDGRTVHVDPRLEAHVDAVDVAARAAERRFPGVLVERKGRIAFVLHWRMTPDLEPSPDDVDALAAEYGLVTHPGRKACELRPPVPVDKGTAFRDLLPDDLASARVAFAGDDRGDLSAFDALDEAEAAGARVARIAVRSGEGPPELYERADVTVDDPAALAALFRELADAVSAPPGRSL